MIVPLQYHLFFKKKNYQSQLLCLKALVARKPLLLMVGLPCLKSNLKRKKDPGFCPYILVT
jgi:hypothetical protein